MSTQGQGKIGRRHLHGATLTRHMHGVCASVHSDCRTITRDSSASRALVLWSSAELVRAQYYEITNMSGQDEMECLVCLFSSWVCFRSARYILARCLPNTGGVEVSSVRDTYTNISTAFFDFDIGQSFWEGRTVGELSERRFCASRLRIYIRAWYRFMSAINDDRL
ncbi:hypothetical protein BS17DRAFT_782815 [Gyrodon lividus]|nr:hypothetical protein BS17DRAFT_782815 [Gyrodon lividus]